MLQRFVLLGSGIWDLGLVHVFGKELGVVGGLSFVEIERLC